MTRATQASLNQQMIETGTLGDWLLTANMSQRRLPLRVAGKGWQSQEQRGNWQIWHTLPQKQWGETPLASLVHGPWETWLLGELYATEQPKSKLTHLLDNPSSAAHLNGHFLIFAWNRDRQEWHVWTDRFGTLHAYYAYDGHHAAIGTYSPSVAAAASQHTLDWTGLTTFFTLGFFATDRTHFTDMRLLRPASHYVFDSNGKQCGHDRYWHWDYAPDRQRSYDDTVDEFAQHWHTVMEEQLSGGRIALPISGGLDSRSTVAALEHIGTPPANLWSYSYGYSADSVETAIARQVATAANLPFTAFTITPYLFQNLPLVTASLEGFQDITQARQACVLDQLRSRSDYLIAAHWGDVWLDDMGLTDSQTANISDEHLLKHTLLKMQKGGRKWLLQHLCQPHLAGTQPDDLVRESVLSELSRLQHIPEADFRVKAFKTEQWSWRWTLASLRMYQPAAFLRLPFYDTRLADFFCTVPSSFVASRQLQIDYLKRYAPHLARITWQSYDTNLYRYQYFDSLLLPKRALKKIWRLLRRKQLIQRNWEVQFLSNSGREQLQHHLLKPNHPIHTFVNPDTISRLLDDFYKNPWTEKRGYTVSMLLTFSTWLQQYG